MISFFHLRLFPSFNESSHLAPKNKIDEALEIDPLSPDAYALLADDARDMDQRMEVLEKAFDVGEQDLGDVFFEEHGGDFWGIVETRPYMRAKLTYAIGLENLGFIEEAIDYAQKNVHLWEDAGAFLKLV